jgi:hypothetical protein
MHDEWFDPMAPETRAGSSSRAKKLRFHCVAAFALVIRPSNRRLTSPRSKATMKQFGDRTHEQILDLVMYDELFKFATGQPVGGQSEAVNSFRLIVCADAD